MATYNRHYTKFYFNNKPLLSSFFLTNKHAFSISFSAKSNVWQNDEGYELKINLLELLLTETLGI